MPDCRGAADGPPARLPEDLPAGDVHLRRWHLGLADDLLHAVHASFAELNRWLPWVSAVPTAESVVTELERASAAFDACTEWQYAIIEPRAGELVGGTGLTNRGSGTFEVGYWVRTDRTRRGYATAAARALIDAGFEHLAHADRVEIRMDLANAASAAVPRRLGLRLLGEEMRSLAATGHAGLGYVWMVERAAWDRLRRERGPARN